MFDYFAASGSERPLTMVDKDAVKNQQMAMKQS